MFFEEGISEADIDCTIKTLDLEYDEGFVKIMRDSEKQIDALFK